MVVKLKIGFECGACFLRQASEAIDLATDDYNLKIELIREIYEFLSSNFYSTTNSNKTGSQIHNLIKERTGCRDPYVQEKAEGNRIALKYIPVVEVILRENDSLENHVKIAIIGNILDFGAFKIDTDVDSLINNALKKELTINDVEHFEESLKNQRYEESK